MQQARAVQPDINEGMKQGAQHQPDQHMPPVGVQEAFQREIKEG
jgi:hypothetical protein